MTEDGYGCYLHYFDLMDPDYVRTGIDKKVLDQISTFERNGFPCRFVYCDKADSLFVKVKMCIPGCDDGIDWPLVESLGSPSFLYLRRPRLASENLLQFLRAFKRANPDATVFYEVPTYPYDNEMRGLIYGPALHEDRRNRVKLAEVVDYIVDLSGADTIFGVPTIQIKNGIDVARVHPRRPQGNRPGLDILCAANFEYWHGIDRIVKGLYDYIERGGEREVRLHLAGGGSAQRSLEALANELGLSDRVTFYGPLSSEQLDQLYDICTIGIECLGMYRRNGGEFVSSSIKSREYLAKGLPFVYSGKIDVVDEEVSPYTLKISASDEPVNMDAIIKFHDALYHDGQQRVVDSLRALAEPRVSMDIAFKNVLDVLRERTGGQGVMA